MSDWCEGGNKIIEVARINEEPAGMIIFPDWVGFAWKEIGLKPKRTHVRCSVCGRRLLASVKNDHDLLEYFYRIPEHKKKKKRKKFFVRRK